MTILSSIRSRVGLLVGIIFLALLSFVLTDLFNSQRGLFGGASAADNSVGEINGHTVTLTEFHNKMEEYSQGKNLSEAEQSQLADAIWQEMLDKYIYEPQYDELGITVSVEELEDQMYGPHPSSYMNQFFQDRQTGQISEKYMGPDGGLNGAAIAKLVKDMTPEQETQWSQIEKDLAKYLKREKYNNLIKKGFYVTTSEANHEYNDENTKYNFKFILKKYADIADSTIKCTDAELQEYYNANQYKFKQADNTRSMDYIAFDIVASANDIADQRTSMERMMAEYKKRTGNDDSLYVTQMTESGAYTKSYLHPGEFPAGSDSSFLKASPGDVLGPFNTSGESISIYKVLGQKTDIDSVHVRHILVAYKDAPAYSPQRPAGTDRNKKEAKMRADSILRVVKSGKKMEDLVAKLTDDKGSIEKQGDYGWLNYNTGMGANFDKKFMAVGYDNPKGATVEIETDFGFFVMQVLDKSAASTKVQVEMIEKKVEPSQTTIRDAYNKAAEFSGTNNTGAAFEDAIKKGNMNVLKATDVKEDEKQISGIENPKEIIRWMYDDKTTVGTVSQPFQVGDRYIVCNLTKILNKGTKPFDEQTVKDICTVEVRKQKKAEMLTAQINKAKAGTLDQWAANAGLTVMPGVNVTFFSPYIQGAGYEGAVVGTLANMTPSKLSEPIKGTMGIYVVMLESVQKPAAMTDVAGEKTKVLSNISSRAEGTAAEVLKDAANITDNRAKHF